MKKHKVEHIIKKPNGNAVAVFADGQTMFVPQDLSDSVSINTMVVEHKHKNGQTVAYSWCDKLYFIVPQPVYFNAAYEFVGKFKLLDRAGFNGALLRAMRYHRPCVLQSTESVAHNLVSLGLKSWVRIR